MKIINKCILFQLYFRHVNPASLTQKFVEYFPVGTSEKSEAVEVL